MGLPQKTMRTIIFLLLFSQFANAQGLPCSSPEYRKFDFWIGEWEAFAKDGSKAGDSKISVILDSCIILEEWTSVAIQKGLRYAGKSFNTYNAETKQWQQTWVDNTGNTTFYSIGKSETNSIVFKSNSFYVSKDSIAIRRLSFYKISAERVRQHGEISIDGEKTWQTEYDLEYRRKNKQ